ncbi:MAG TPA: 50S ribosomal protein L25 [Candidatus Hypogeohydataceae bacterium YC38]|nr:50S ribosomal protein L25 [Candidatus Brocadiales bacterium]
MESPVLQAERRGPLGTRAARRLRREGKVPAVLYGHEVENIPISIPQGALKTAIQMGARMVSIRWDDKEEMALLKETQYDAFGKEILHADLVRVALDKRIVLEVPIELRGTPAGLAEDGVLEQVLRKVKVECLPRAIPEKLTADVSRLRLGESITFKDLELPHDVKVAEEDTGAMVAMVRKIVEEEVKPAVEEEVAKEPEVITRKPKEEEEEEKS